MPESLCGGCVDALAHHTGLPLADADVVLVALVTADDRHYRMVVDIEIRRFRPSR